MNILLSHTFCKSYIRRRRSQQQGRREAQGSDRSERCDGSGGGGRSFNPRLSRRLPRGAARKGGRRAHLRGERRGGSLRRASPSRGSDSGEDRSDSSAERRAYRDAGARRGAHWQHRAPPRYERHATT